MNLRIVIKGADELQARLQPELVQEPLQEAVEAVAGELATPKGNGLGVRLNTLGLTVSGMAARVETSLVWPRTTGQAWLGHSLDDADPLVEEALARVEQAMAEGWEG